MVITLKFIKSIIKFFQDFKVFNITILLLILSFLIPYFPHLLIIPNHQHLLIVIPIKSYYQFITIIGPI